MPRYKQWRIQITQGDIPVEFSLNNGIPLIVIGDYDATEFDINSNLKLWLQLKIKKPIDNVYNREVIDIDCGKPWNIKQPKNDEYKSFKLDNVTHHRFIITDATNNNKILAGFDRWEPRKNNKEETKTEGLFKTNFNLDGELVWRIEHGSENDLPVLCLNKNFKENITDIKKYIDSFVLPKFIREVIKEQKDYGQLIPEDGDKSFWNKWYTAISEISELDKKTADDDDLFDEWLDNFEEELCKISSFSSILIENEEDL